MIGRKFKDMYKEHALKENIPEEDLRHILNCYYKHVAIAVEGLAFPRIEILGLGKLTLKKPNALLKELEEMKYEEGPFINMLNQLRADKEKKEQKRAEPKKK